MLTEQQILEANELFASAVSYNLAMQSAFVSKDDMVTCTLNVNGMQQTVSIPTWHHILLTVNQLANQVKQLQITDDGHDIVQLLSQANNLRFVYLKRQQYYVQPPIGAVVDKFDYDTVPTSYSASDRTAMFVNLTNCDLPMDALYAIVKLDDDKPMRLPILYNTTCFDKVATVLSIDNSTMLVDNNTFKLHDTVQVHSSLYEVVYSYENKIELKATGIATADIVPGDNIYNVIDTVEAFVEVPVTKMHSSMSLQIQYMKLLSAKATYDIAETMASGIHAAKQTALSSVLTGKSSTDTMQVLNTSVQALPDNLAAIVAESRPAISKINITQTNAHQYINSTVEELAKANAALTLARSDIDRYEQLLAQASLTTDMIAQYKEQLASAQARYEAAQADIAAMEVSSQDVSPEYEATVYSSSVDSNAMPIVQYIARYQRLSYDVKELTNDWQYVYGNKRTIDSDGNISSDIDDYSVMNFIKLPIRAYEQLAIQIAAVLCYGQPSMTITTDWSDVTYTQIPNDILKEQSVEDMFKNAYEARIYYNLQQAMQAAGVYSHIDTTKSYMHKASDIQFAGDVTLLDKLTEIMQNISSLTDVANASMNIAVELVYNGKSYAVANGGSVQIDIDKTYCSEVFDSLTVPADINAALGTIVEHEMLLRVINKGAQSAMFTTMIAGMPTQALTDNVLNYCNVGIHSDTDFAQTYGQAMYASKTNASGSVQLVYDRILQGSDLNALAFGDNAAAPAVKECDGDIISTGVLQDNLGLGIHSGQYAMLNFDAFANHDGFAVHAGWQYDNNTVDKATTYGDLNTATDAKSTALKQAILDNSAKFGIGMASTKHTQLGLYKLTNVGIGTITAPEVLTQPWFISNDKFTSGKCTRGAALYFAPATASDIKLGANGTTNGVMIEPGDSAALQIPIKFQNRMTDRLGLVDGVDALTYADSTLVNGDPGSALTYTKSMSIHMNIGNSDFKFDLIVSQSYR